MRVVGMGFLIGINVPWPEVRTEVVLVDHGLILSYDIGASGEAAAVFRGKISPVVWNRIEGIDLFAFGHKVIDPDVAVVYLKEEDRGF
jgi:hypothetical protein